MKGTASFLIALIFVACNQESKTGSADEAVTKSVLDHHLQTFQQNDLEGVMADYVAESVLITPDRTYKGLAEIRENFVEAFEALPVSVTTMTVTKSVVSKDVAYIVWKAVTPKMEIKFATDTFIIADGKIISQTFAGESVAITSEVAPTEKK